MASIGSGEYDPVDIAGYLVDVLVLVLQGVRNRASTLGDLVAIVLILLMIITLLGAFATIPVLFIGAIMAFSYTKKGKKGFGSM